MKRIILAGGGGHCGVVIDAIKREDYEIYGIVDIKTKVGKFINGVEIIGTDEDLEKYYEKGIENAFVTLGSVGNSNKRRQIYDKLKKIGFKIPNLVSSKAIVSESVKFEEGIFVAAGAIINSKSIIAKNVIINTGSIIEHDCKIGEFSHISTGAILCGGVEIENNCHIGAGSIIIQSKKIGESTVIGAGSVVVKDIEAGMVAYGNPCKEVKRNV